MAHKTKQSPKPIVGDIAKRISRSGLAIDSQPVLKTSGAMDTHAALSPAAIISTPTTASPTSVPSTPITTALSLPLTVHPPAAIISTPTTTSPISVPHTPITTTLSLPPTGEGHISSSPTQIPFVSTTLMSPLPLTQQPFSTPLPYTSSLSPTPPQPYAMSQFVSPRVPPETIDYIFMELHRLRDHTVAQDQLIQSMRQEITHLRQDVVSLTATVTAAPCTTPKVEEPIATIQTAIAKTTR